MKNATTAVIFMNIFNLYCTQYRVDPPLNTIMDNGAASYELIQLLQPTHNESVKNNDKIDGETLNKHITRNFRSKTIVPVKTDYEATNIKVIEAYYNRNCNSAKDSIKNFGAIMSYSNIKAEMWPILKNANKNKVDLNKIYNGYIVFRKNKNLCLNCGYSNHQTEKCRVDPVNSKNISNELIKQTQQQDVHKNINKLKEYIDLIFFIVCNIEITHSDPRQRYTQQSLVIKYHVDLEQIHELSLYQKLSNKELLFKAIENAQDDEAYLALALGSCNLGQAIVIPDGMIACWKHLHLQALDINPSNPLILLSLFRLMLGNNQLGLDQTFLDPKSSFIKETYYTLILDPHSATYINASPLTSKITFFDGKVVDQADVIIEFHAISEVFFSVLHMLNVELVQEKEFNRAVKKILVKSSDLSTQWNLCLG
ncbi:hypothetical protein ACTFIZ_007948 [Dictyostelium cf. discoideum]